MTSIRYINYLQKAISFLAFLWLIVFSGPILAKSKFELGVNSEIDLKDWNECDIIIEGTVQSFDLTSGSCFIEVNCSAAHKGQIRKRDTIKLYFGSANDIFNISDSELQSPAENNHNKIWKGQEWLAYGINRSELNTAEYTAYYNKEGNCNTLTRPKLNASDGNWMSSMAKLMNTNTDSNHIFYGSDGQRLAQGALVNGYATGKWTYYYDFAASVEQGCYDKSKKIGEWTYSTLYNSQYLILNRTQYKEGKLVSSADYNYLGYVSNNMVITSDSITTERYYDNGILQSRKVSFLLLDQYKIYTYYENGQLESESQYKNCCEPTGLWLSFDTLGNIVDKRNYNNAVAECISKLPKTNTPKIQE
jgi:antitoxin component YwqK of YwqJK toxin-antitoxin module